MTASAPEIRPPLVIFSTQAWSKLWVSKHWIAYKLSQERQVVFVEPPRRIALKSIGGGRSMRPTIRKIKRNLHSLTPCTLPSLYRVPSLARPLWRFPLHRQIQNGLRILGIDRFSVLSFDPHSLPLVRRFGGRVINLVYYAVDPPLGKEDALWPETRIVREADHVVAVTERLARILKSESGRTDIYVVPHGVDSNDASELGDCEQQIPDCFNHIGADKVLIGYVGVIHDICVDVALIKYAACEKPEWEFTFVGPTSGSELSRRSLEIREFDGVPNVHFCGEMPFNTLKCAISHFDVCIVPYRADVSNKWERRSPFKVLHYFAQGKPVVISSVPAADDYDDLVYSYTDHGEFIDRVEAALLEPERLKQARKRFAADRRFSALLGELRTFVD